MSRSLKKCCHKWGLLTKVDQFGPQFYFILILKKGGSELKMLFKYIYSLLFLLKYLLLLINPLTILIETTYIEILYDCPEASP